MPDNYEAIEKAIQRALSLKAIWAGKVQDATDVRNKGAVDLAAAEQTMQAAVTRAERAYRTAMDKAKGAYEEVKTQVDDANRVAEGAISKAHQDLADHQAKVREEHGAVIDLMNVTSGGGRTRL